MDAVRCLDYLFEVTCLQIPKVVALLFMEKERRRLIHLLKEVDFILDVHLDHSYLLATYLFF